jgi:hypothetical protein
MEAFTIWVYLSLLIVTNDKVNRLIQELDNLDGSEDGFESCSLNVPWIHWRFSETSLNVPRINLLNWYNVRYIIEHYRYHRAITISLKLNLRDCDRPMIKLLLLGGARSTNPAIEYT